MKKENWLYKVNDTKKGGYFAIDGNTDYEAFDWVWGQTKEEAVENFIKKNRPTTLKQRFEATNPRATLLGGHLYFREEDVLSFISSECERARGEVATAYKEYVDFLEKDISINSVYLRAHSITASEEDIKKGEELRAKIASLTHTKL